MNRGHRLWRWDPLERDRIAQVWTQSEFAGLNLAERISLAAKHLHVSDDEMETTLLFYKLINPELFEGRVVHSTLPQLPALIPH